MSDTSYLDTLTPAERARYDRALAQIVKLGDPVLRARCAPVSRFDAELAATVQRMSEIMIDADGAGLAAPQLGDPRRIVTYRTEHSDDVHVLINPTVTHVDGEPEQGPEGCLSIPGTVLLVDRPPRLTVAARDLHGRAFVREAEGFEARVIQHELDHLDGILILDRA